MTTLEHEHHSEGKCTKLGVVGSTISEFAANPINSTHRISNITDLGKKDRAQSQPTLMDYCRVAHFAALKQNCNH